MLKKLFSFTCIFFQTCSIVSLADIELLPHRQAPLPDWRVWSFVWRRTGVLGPRLQSSGAMLLDDIHTGRIQIESDSTGRKSLTGKKSWCTLKVATFSFPPANQIQIGPNLILKKCRTLIFLPVLCTHTHTDLDNLTTPEMQLRI